MANKQSIAVPVIKATRIEVSDDPRGEARVILETSADTDVVLVLPMVALAELEALLARSSQEQAKRHPKQ